ncbi:uncharacterized protein LOC120326153 [Styela clava]
MAVRPKIRPSNGIAEEESEELFCGYVMHQQKSFSPKMRWGQLWTSKADNGLMKCDIRLFKYDIVSPKPGTFTKKDLRLKLSFQFTEEEFCGLEKGEHYMKGGMRRYICVILKDKHLIVQDAITAMTDTDHNVLGTWYSKITEAMHYMSRWQIFQSEKETGDMRYFHASRVNLCECFSLHNSHAGRKGKILLDKLFKTDSIAIVDEVQEVHNNGVQCSRVTFYDKNYSVDVKISVVVHGMMKLSEILTNLSQGRQPERPTLCSRFDDLNGNPNLVRIPPERKKDPPARSLRDLSGSERNGLNNIYISQDEPDMRLSGDLAAGSSHAMPNVSQRSPQSMQFRFNRVHNPSYELPSKNSNDTGHRSYSNPFSNGSVNAGPRHHNTNRPLMPPPEDSGDLKKTMDPTSQISVDSDYLTDENFTANMLQSSATNVTSEMPGTPNNIVRIASREHVATDETDRPYVNLANHADALEGAVGDSVMQTMAQSIDEEPTDAIPPKVPPREANNENIQDLIRNAIKQQNLLPTCTDSNQYINSMNIEMTIAILLKDINSEAARASLGLPYSTYMALILGLEIQSVSQSDWRGLASELEFSFRDVGIIESAVQTYNLSPAQIVLLHWYRTQSPYPFTCSVLKKILLKAMQRLDLADLLPEEDADDESSLSSEKNMDKN